MSTLERLLRDHDGLRDAIDAGHDHREFARSFIGIILIAGGLLGGVIGSFRGGLQIPFAAIKLPLVVLLTAAVCTPALTVLRRAMDPGLAQQIPLSKQLARDIVLLLASLALGIVGAAATAPLLMLVMALGFPYHALALSVVGACAIGGLVGLSFLWRGLSVGGGAFTVVASLMMVVVMVGGQMAWIGRPYLVRPQAEEVVFLRAAEGDLLSAVEGSLGTILSPGDAQPAYLPPARAVDTLDGRSER